MSLASWKYVIGRRQAETKGEGRGGRIKGEEGRGWGTETRDNGRNRRGEERKKQTDGGRI